MARASSRNADWRDGELNLAEFLATRDPHDKCARREGLERLDSYLAALSAAGSAQRHYRGVRMNVWENFRWMEGHLVPASSRRCNRLLSINCCQWIWLIQMFRPRAILPHGMKPISCPHRQNIPGMKCFYAVHEQHKTGLIGMSRAL